MGIRVRKGNTLTPEKDAITLIEGTNVTIGLNDDTSAQNDAEITVTGVTPEILPFVVTGTLTVAAGVIEVPVPFAATLVSATTRVSTAPTGASLLVDVNKNGTTIFTTQGNRPTITAGTKQSTAAVPDVTTVAAGDYISVDVDQVGASVAGSNLSVVVRFVP